MPIGSHEVYSNIPSSLRKIYEAHWETGNEVGSKNGMAIAMASREALESHKTSYQTTVVNGKRIIKKSAPRAIGTIVNRRGQTLNVRLKNFIQWRTYSTTGTTVVGGMFKSGTTEIRRNGKVVSKRRVDSVGKGSINILQKLNYGLNQNSNRINKVGNPFDWQGKESMKKFKGTHTKGLGFMEEGRRKAMSKVNKNTKEGFENAILRRNLNQRMEKVV